MKKILPFIWLVLGLVSCQSHHAEVNYINPTLPTISPGAIITQPILPGAHILLPSAPPVRQNQPRSQKQTQTLANTILNAIISERVRTKMRIKLRTNYLLSMAIKVPYTKKITEAQIVYTLHQYKSGGFWLSAKAYQVTNPGTAQQTMVDVTPRVVQNLQSEINQIAKKFNR